MFYNLYMPTLSDALVHQIETAVERLRADRAIDRPFCLSKRQRECLSLAGRGRREREIAGALGISRATVRNHLVVARRRLQARNTAHAVAIALRAQLISVDMEER